MQVLSSNEFLRGRIRKEKPFFYFPSFNFFWFVLFSFVFCCCRFFFFQGDPGPWVSISKGGSLQLAVSLIIHERGDGVLG